LLILRRVSGWGDHLRNYKVILDGKEVGHIADGETLKCDVAPGEHTLYLKIDYARSQKRQFHSSKDKDVEFVCSPNVQGFKVLMFFLYLTILSTRYVRLEQTK